MPLDNAAAGLVWSVGMALLQVGVHAPLHGHASGSHGSVDCHGSLGSVESKSNATVKI